MSNIYTVSLIERKEIAFGTMAFLLEKPQDFVFKAGQYIDMTLKNPPYSDEEGNVRTFSIASSPSEPHLMVATRMRNSAFKNSLRAMPLGSKVQIQGPMGSFTLHNDTSRSAVFLAGGIGITPFRSIIVYAAAEHLPHRIFLFYSNRRPEDAAFLEELIELQKKNPNYTCIATMTEIKNSQKNWSGDVGYIDAKLLSDNVPDISRAIFYIAGPPAMVTSMYQLLNSLGVADDNIKTEEFGGY